MSKRGREALRAVDACSFRGHRDYGNEDLNKAVLEDHEPDKLWYYQTNIIRKDHVGTHIEPSQATVWRLHVEPLQRWRPWHRFDTAEENLLLMNRRRSDTAYHAKEAQNGDGLIETHNDGEEEL